MTLPFLLRKLEGTMMSTLRRAQGRLHLPIEQQTCSLKTETGIGEFDAGERLFMKNKFVFLELS
ncbi:MAG: hypothetical protein ACHQNE_02955, partial [Candidatus Kapaibacterium sp.]